MFRDREAWRVQWSACGKRLSKRFASRGEAERFSMELKLGLVDKKRPTERKIPTFAEFAERWLKEYSLTEKRAASHDEDSRVIRRHLAPAFGERRITGLRKADLIELRSRLLTTPAKGRLTTLNPKSVNNVLMVAKKIMGHAVDLDLLTENPWRGVKQCKVTEKVFDFWRPSEREEFYERAMLDRPDIAQLAYLACHTGLRRGELAALTWGAVDFERRKLRVSASFNLRAKIHGPTKGGEVAEVPLNAAALGVLRARYETRSGTTVFPTGLFANNLRRDFTTLCLRVGARPIRFHDTRHTFASCLAMAGVDLLVIQQLLRHKCYQMTLRYAHLHPSHLAGATDVLCTQVARITKTGMVSGPNQVISERTLSDSNARPSGSKGPMGQMVVNLVRV